MATPRIRFQDVKARILARIRDGEWKPGALLPGEVDLAYEFGCARATVNRALRDLSDEGVIDRRRKAGTRVRQMRSRAARFNIPLVRAEVEASGAAYRYALVARATVPAATWLAARLGLAPGADLMELTCMHYADSAPFQHEHRWVNIAAVPQILQADLAATSPNEWLVSAVPFTDIDLAFSAIAAPESLAQFLQCRPGAPVFQAERTTWLDGAPVTHAVLSFAPGYRMATRY